MGECYNFSKAHSIDNFYWLITEPIENLQLKKKPMKMILIVYVLYTLIGCNLNNESIKVQKEVAIQSYIVQNEKTYEDVYMEISDEVNRMKKDRLKSTLLNVIHDSRIDKLIIFNKEKTKLYTTLNTSAKIYEHSSSDLVQSLYGVKIDGKWHVYFGANLIALREGYKTNKYEPFTWDELSYVAHEQMFGRFIDFDENGNMLTKHDMVEKYVNPWDIGGTSISHEGTEEERFLRLTAYNQSKKLDSTEYQQLLEEINNSESKEREPIKKLAWWDKLLGAEVPIFDTKVWKEYIAGKNKGK